MRELIKKLFISLFSLCLFVNPAVAEDSDSRDGDIEIADPDELVLNFWDSHRFNKINNDSINDFQEEYLDFLSLLSSAKSENVIQQGFNKLILLAEENLGSPDYIDQLAARFLYTQSSPYLSENHYLLYLKTLLSWDKLTESQKYRIEDKIENVEKNMRGSKANDFSFLTLSDSTSTLYQTIDDDCILLLMFFDPECEHCDEAISYLKENQSLSEGMDSGHIRVLAVYCGENKLSWLRKAELMPQNWVIGYNDGEIEDTDLYYLPSMPTIYLLDGQGMVLQKDIDPVDILNLDFDNMQSFLKNTDID